MLNKNDVNGTLPMAEPVEDKALGGVSGGTDSRVQRTAQIVKERCFPGSCSECGAGDTTPCMEMCPTGAIQCVSDYVAVDSDSCINCNVCCGACPFNAISVVW